MRTRDGGNAADSQTASWGSSGSGTACLGYSSNSRNLPVLPVYPISPSRPPTVKPVRFAIGRPESRDANKFQRKKYTIREFCTATKIVKNFQLNRKRILEEALRYDFFRGSRE